MDSVKKEFRTKQEHITETLMGCLERNVWPELLRARFPSTSIQQSMTDITVVTQTTRST